MKPILLVTGHVAIACGSNIYGGRKFVFDDYS
jgi:hypothetical protein